MDNLEINPSEFYYALRDIKLSIDELEDVKELLKSISNLDYDVSSYDDEVKNTIDNIIEKAYVSASKKYKFFDLIITPENVEIRV